MEQRKFVGTINLNINIIFIKIIANNEYDYFKLITQYTSKIKNNLGIKPIY